MRHHPTTSELVLWHYLKASQLGVGLRGQVVVGSYRGFPRAIGAARGGGRWRVSRGAGAVVQLDAAWERRLERCGYTVVRLSGECVVSEPLVAVGVIVQALGRLR